MNFDFGEVMNQAWQITRKHKILWGFSLLPMIPAIFYLPFILYFFLSIDLTNGVPDFLRNPTLIILSFVFILLLVAVSLLLQVFSHSATTFGLYQVEQGKDNLTFDEVRRGGQVFFWRILGAVLLTTLGMMAVFAVFSACLSLVGFVTFGLGSLLGQLLFLPATLFAYAVVEQTQAAIVADSLKPVDAINRAWELVNKNISQFAVLTVILYFGLSILGSVMLVPVMLPLFLGVLSKFTSEFSNPSLTWIAMLVLVAFLPLYLLVRAGTMLFTKAAYMITYLRLTRSLKLQPLPESVEATS